MHLGEQGGSCRTGQREELAAQWSYGALEAKGAWDLAHMGVRWLGCLILG